MNEQHYFEQFSGEIETENELTVCKYCGQEIKSGHMHIVYRDIFGDYLFCMAVPSLELLNYVNQDWDAKLRSFNYAGIYK
jgi:hypothetical protein